MSFKANKIVYDCPVNDFKTEVVGEIDSDSRRCYSNRRLRAEAHLDRYENAFLTISVVDQVFTSSKRTFDDEVREQKTYYIEAISKMGFNVFERNYYAQIGHLLQYIADGDLTRRGAEDAIWSIVYALEFRNEESMFKKWAPKWYSMLNDLHKQYEDTFEKKT